MVVGDGGYEIIERIETRRFTYWYLVQKPEDFSAALGLSQMFMGKVNAGYVRLLSSSSFTLWIPNFVSSSLVFFVRKKILVIFSLFLHVYPNQESFI